MRLDTRNPFAAWGFEEEKYAVNVAEGDDSGIVKLEEKGFINETVVDEAYNKVAEPISAEDYSKQHSDQASFFTNNENMLPTSLANKAYGDDQTLQREYPAGEPLNYYGNEADDLHLYGDPEEPDVPSKPEEIINTPEQDETAANTIADIEAQIAETGKAATVTIPEGETLGNITIPQTVSKGVTINGVIANGATIRNDSSSYTTINNTGEAVDVIIDAKGDDVNGTVYPKGEYNDIYTDSSLSGSSSTYPTVHGDITIDENCNKATSINAQLTEDNHHKIATNSDFGGKELTISNTTNPDTEPTTPNLEVIARNASVKLNGTYNEVEVSCSPNTLKLGTNFHANRLTVKQGKLYLECVEGEEKQFFDKLVLGEGVTVVYATTEITASNLTGLTGSSVFAGKAIVMEDIELTNKCMATGIFATGKEVLDLNGHTVKMGRNEQGCIYLRGTAKMNIIDSVGNGKLINNAESYGVWTGAEGNIVNIYGGRFEAYTHVMYAYLGEINIYGGEFKMLGENPDLDEKGHYKFLLNCYDANYQAGTARIKVYGGKYYNFNPAEAYGEPGAPISYVADGYKSVMTVIEGVEVFEVVPNE
jgi:hypothetical protein